MDKKLFNQYKKISRKINEYTKKSAVLDLQLKELRQKLKNSCDHPIEYQYKFMWEHDNGYGKQTQIEGVRCSICLSQKNWSSQNYWTNNGHITSFYD